MSDRRHGPVHAGAPRKAHRVVVAVVGFHELECAVVCQHLEIGGLSPRPMSAQHAQKLRSTEDVERHDVYLVSGGQEALTTLTQILRVDDRAAVIVITDHENDGEMFSALRAGARGYLAKTIEPARLPRVVHGVLAGEAALSRVAVGQLAHMFHTRPHHRLRAADKRLVDVTPRERQVLHLLRAGYSTAEIADRMHVTPVTVRSHIATAINKLGVTDRGEAVTLLQQQSDDWSVGSSVRP
jgi:DNA-binding NarL/FixJ family response regulator